MSGVTKAGIYVDAQNMYDNLYKAQFFVTKSDRMALFPHMLNACLNVKSNFVLSYVASEPSRKLEFIENMISEFENLKSDIITMNRLNMLKSNQPLIDKSGEHNEEIKKTTGKSVKREISDILARMEEQCEKWVQNIRA